MEELSSLLVDKKKADMMNLQASAKVSSNAQRTTNNKLMRIILVEDYEYLQGYLCRFRCPSERRLN